MKPNNAMHVLVLLLSLPAILEPHFDLLCFNVSKEWTLPNDLLPSGRTRLWTFNINPLQSLHLFRCVPHILATIHELLLVWCWISLHTKCHNNKTKKRNVFLGFRKTTLVLSSPLLPCPLPQESLHTPSSDHALLIIKTLDTVSRVKEKGFLLLWVNELYLEHTHQSRDTPTERDGTKSTFLNKNFLFCETVNANTKKQTDTTKWKGLVGRVVAP